MSNKMLIERLRTMCADIRRKPIALEHLIPLMQEAATEMERLRAEVEALRSDAERKRIKLENMGDVITSLRSEVELYRGESERFHGLLNSVPLPPYAITYERGWELIYMFQAAAIDASRAAQGLTNPK